MEELPPAFPSRLNPGHGRCTPAQAALAWVLAHGSNVHPVVGTRRPERLADLQAAAELTLGPERVAWLAEGRGPGAPAAGSRAAS